MKFYNGPSNHSTRGVFSGERAVSGAWGRNYPSNIILKTRHLKKGGQPTPVDILWLDITIWDDNKLWGIK